MRQTSDLMVVALGGNAIQRPDDDSVESDFVHTKETAGRLASLLVSTGNRLVVTHGNGPQVGNHLLRSQLGHDHGGLPLLPLDVCVADTQGGMGYMLQQTLTNAFHERHMPAAVASVVTQVVVSADDPGFDSPTKPVGEAIPEERTQEFRERGWTLAFDKGRNAWRRVVASPDPLELVEAEAIRALVDAGVVVVATGGGGVPVIVDDRGELSGVAAVVDKDLASALLAEDLRAQALIIATDVDRVFLDYGTPQQRPLERASVSEARGLLQRGEFPPGSMGPKVEALCRFVEATGGVGVITSIDLCETALTEGVGTRIVP